MSQAAAPLRIGFGMALTGGLAAQGKAALLAMEIWRDEVNKNGGLLGRPVEFVYYDDQSKPASVPGIYTKLLDVDKVDFVVSGYGHNLIAPAMPIVIERQRVFMGLMGLAINEKYNYPYYFQIGPFGPTPTPEFSRAFFALAATQHPTPRTVALIGLDAEGQHRALAGARENLKQAGLEVVYDNTYPPATVDFTPIIRAIKATNPDVVFVASYPPDSMGIVLAAHEVGFKPKLFGGAMVGLQFAAFQTKLGAKLNGIVNFAFWVPEPTLNFPGIHDFLQKYQAQAEKHGVDPLGHYLPPWAYAMMQVFGQAVEGAKSTAQQAVGEYLRTHAFETIVGKVKFDANGEWEKPRMLLVQYQHIKGNDLAQFVGPGKQVVLLPEEWQSGHVIYPYTEALK
jgi:branched-chain amino acid transport system substrate-binding protein